MNLVEVKRISYYPPSKGYAVLLEEKAGDKRNLPIIVGSAEAQAIALYLEGVEMPRPMTHDLLINMIDTLDAEINKITISRLHKGTIFAEIEVSNLQIGEIVIDSRPSDAIAVALRSSTSIYVSNEVMDMASKLKNEITIENQIPINLNQGKLNKETEEEMSLVNLNEALEKAILDEEYEVAANLRDRIKRIGNKSSLR